MKVITIGGGLGGLSAACLLASEGHEVTVLEKNSSVGGKIGEVSAQGYRFDTGPSLLTMPFILKDLFDRCGVALSDYLTLDTLDPICNYFYRNGTEFNCHKSSCVNVAQIQKFAPDDVQAYKEFIAYSAKLYERTKDAFLYNPLYELSDVGSVKWRNLLHIDAFQTVAERVDKCFQSIELQQFFKRFTTYNGSSPYQAPATMNVIPHVEITMGGYYIRGGMYRLIEALVQLAKDLGVQLITNCFVKNIKTENQQVTGVEDQDHQCYPADVIVSNADAYETYLNITHSTDISIQKKKQLEQVEPSCSGFVLLLGIDTKYPALSHHNIFFTGDYEREFQQIFQEKRMPEDPTIYIANTSYTDPQDAPEGGSNLFVLINAPYLTPGDNWQEQKHQYKSFVVNELEKRGLDGLGSHIQYSNIITPEDFQTKYRSNRGSIYGTSSNNKLSAFLRPRNKSRSLEGLYLVGGSTHPGGGIPLVTLSAFHAVELINRYE
ncbi:phytoene desaturase family protein [Fodinibius salsisoli]|uniref:Phytoene desaturase n=1 Tax=Fodinibius salsisoli TaxID=2820877 RepID=A0ABT3PQY4_9BACT|nr:phytoene desaturase family protein [Fodinibius salsisoli]MCW9708273.1 phytoene desaturase [Fodinibius salsisoli]